MKYKRQIVQMISIAMTAIMLLSAWGAVGPVNRAYADGVTYYMDAVNGNDSNNGTSEATAWKSLAKVNNKTNFQPGDHILFKSGGSWSGSLKLKSSGAEGNPIVVGKYGDGPTPIINANAAYAAIDLENIQYITLQDLELTNFNPAAPDDYKTGFYRRSGIWIKSFHNGPMNDITIRNMDIHDVTGMNLTGEATTTTTDGKDKGVNKNANAGIQIEAWEFETGKPKAYIDGLTLENNYIHDLAVIGVNITAFSNDVAYFNRNVTIKGNTVSNTGADGIIVGVSVNPLIEHNISLDAGAYAPGIKWIAGIWVWRTDRALVQFNEVGRTRAEIKADSDSAAFDTDLATRGDHIFQYNYTHDNAGGFFMDMGQLKGGINILRYNISQNDKRDGWHSYTMNINDPGIYYNNVFYNDLGIGFQMKNNPNATYMNNVFYVTGPSPVTETYPTGPKFLSNAFYGKAAPAQGKNNVVGDPGFVDPGKGVDGYNTVDGYKLKPDSPLIGAGTVVANNGGRDFWNNPIYRGSPDIGAFEDSSTAINDTIAPVKPTAVAVKDYQDSTVTLTWAASENGVELDAEIYNAANNQLLTSVIASNEATVTGLTPDTDYNLYVVAKDRNWNASEPSANIAVKTRKSVIIDDTQAVKVGTWTAATGTNSYNNNFVKIAAGSGTNSVKWTPQVTIPGFYAVYYYLPDGGSSRAGNAKYTVTSSTGSKTYTADQRPVRGGTWNQLGIHSFSAGTSGFVQLSDAASGEVVADAIKLVYLDGFGLEDIARIQLFTTKLQLREGETTRFSVTGTDSEGQMVELPTDSAELSYIVDDPTVATINGGIVSGISNGVTHFHAKFSYNGRFLDSNSVELIVGPKLAVETPTFTDANGQELTAMKAGTITVSSRIINSSEKHLNATLIVVLHGPAGIVETKSQEVVLNKYDNNTLTVSITTPERVEGYSLKAFIWDNLTDMTALTDLAILQ
ncbi:fibronectin type III domain-containing protein [Paenibacillus qinlingensis]|uniref:golvesin C-terminal-like domain-containing protein n=1 Tax=Paenibacillus qinlingensis TaxID=1837343 RepID=UPI0015672F00|nr:fibronectin type III domain-containing protein [Paenibacillus qinlingensis]NQX58441.1 right-handed parallel beta-helix repeat-containing protein [Paenibacillus qinlingensis]